MSVEKSSGYKVTIKHDGIIMQADIEGSFSAVDLAAICSLLVEQLKPSEECLEFVINKMKEARE